MSQPPNRDRVVYCPAHKHYDDADDEHGAWTDACDKLNTLLAYASHGASTLPAVTVNDTAADALVDAIRYWGETLVALRVNQPEERRAAALRDAGRLAREGRPVRRG